MVYAIIKFQIPIIIMLKLQYVMFFFVVITGVPIRKKDLSTIFAIRADSCVLAQVFKASSEIGHQATNV